MQHALPKEYLARMQLQLGGEYAAYLRAMENVPPRALRVNTAKIAPEAFEQLADFPLTPVSEAPACYRFPDGVAIGKHPLHMAGLCYVQEPSAQQPVRLLGVEPGMTVLDLCAAPGGKAGQIAELLGSAGILIANEPVAARARTLRFNLERLGVKNAVVTSLYPAALCGRLSDRCDAVLVDAPCSGEGMFRREPDAVADWSAAHVLACATRQLRILDAAAGAVKPGGTLVYATCTFSPEENEGVVRAFLAAHPAFSLQTERRLYPHTFPGEGQFMARLVRADGAARVITEPDGQTGGEADAAHARRRGKQKCPAAQRGVEAGKIAPWEAFCTECLTRPPTGRATLLSDGRVLLLPEAYFDGLDGLRVLCAGVQAGEIHDARFVPAHALYLALPPERFRQRAELAGTALDAYLAGETVACDKGLSGWCAVTYRGYCLGFGKAVSGTLKNHLPKGLRR